MTRSPIKPMKGLVPIGSVPNKHFELIGKDVSKGTKLRRWKFSLD